MSRTSRGRAGTSASGEAGRLVADAVMDVLADALLHRTGRDRAAADATPERPPPAQDAQRADDAPARAPVADAAQDRLEAAAAALVSAVMSRVDVNAILDRVDVQRVVDRVDVGEVVQRVDLNEVLAEVDVNAVVERVDVDQILERVDVGAVVDEALEGIDLGEVVRESTASLGTDTVEGFRQQAMIADGRIARVVDRVLRRSGQRETALKPPAGGS